MIEYSQIVVIIAAIITVLVTATDRKLVKRFRAESATSPETAIVFERVGRLANWRLGRLLQKGVIYTTEFDNYYFDESTYAVMHKRRRVIALSILSVLTVIVLLLNAIIS